MRPEDFMDRWGEPLRACGLDAGSICFAAGGARHSAAVGLLVTFAADRNCAVVQADSMTSGHAWWQMRRITGSPVSDDEESYIEFDDALIAGCLALAGEEARR